MSSSLSGDDGRPALVFIHGGLSDREDWTAQVEALGPGVPSAAPDLPGHGGASPPEEVSIAALARAIHFARRPLGSAPVVLVGHGFGCNIALDVYAQDPEGVIGLVMIEGHPLVPTVSRNLPNPDGASPSVREALLRTFETLYSPDIDPALKARRLAYLSAVDGVFLRGLIACVGEWHRAEPVACRIKRVAVPVLLLESTRLDAGAFTALEPGGSAEWTSAFKALNPRAVARRVEGGGHFPQLQVPRAVAAQIARFVGDLTPKWSSCYERG